MYGRLNYSISLQKMIENYELSQLILILLTFGMKLYWGFK